MLKPIRVYKSGSKIGSISTSEKKKTTVHTLQMLTLKIFLIIDTLKD